MPYGDVRSTLSTASQESGAPRETADPEAYDFSVLPPDEVTGLGSQTWIVRAQNVVLAYTSVHAGDVLTRLEQPDEYAIILPHDSSAVRVTAGDESASVKGKSVVIVPPGRSEVSAVADTDVVRLFTPFNTNIAALARNAASYAKAHPVVSPLVEWPEPIDGYKLRVYSGLADIENDPSRFGRIFRSRAFMVNFSFHRDGPRPTTNLSPHQHSDFEQISLGVEGEFIHHLRTPWGNDKAGWRADQHVRVGSPSVTIIPPPLLHTTEHSGPGRNQLLDVFAPPRVDFSEKGWVINSKEYPAPSGLSEK